MKSWKKSYAKYVHHKNALEISRVVKNSSAIMSTTISCHKCCERSVRIDRRVAPDPDAGTARRPRISGRFRSSSLAIIAAGLRAPRKKSLWASRIRATYAHLCRCTIYTAGFRSARHAAPQSSSCSKSPIDISRLPIGESPGVNSGGHAEPENKRARRSLLPLRHSASLSSLYLDLQRAHAGKSFPVRIVLVKRERKRERIRLQGRLEDCERGQGNCKNFL